jgi:hypothetical protein
MRRLGGCHAVALVRSATVALLGQREVAGWSAAWGTHQPQLSLPLRTAPSAKVAVRRVQPRTAGVFRHTVAIHSLCTECGRREQILIGHTTGDLAEYAQPSSRIPLRVPSLSRRSLAPVLHRRSSFASGAHPDGGKRGDRRPGRRLIGWPDRAPIALRHSIGVGRPRVVVGASNLTNTMKRCGADSATLQR